jgi:outer membrane lipoprotein-sorting protein
MKKLILLMIIFLPVVIFAQKEKDAEILLKKAADKALSYKTIDTKFKFTIESVQDKSKENYSGKLLIKGSKFKMTLNSSITFCDGKTRWVYMKESNEVNVSTINKSEDLDPEDRFLIDPISIFTVYKKGFKYKIDGTQTIENKKYTVVSLAPEDKTKPYFKIKIWISEDFDYYSIKYFQKDGTRIILQLTDFSSNNKYKDSFFSFDKTKYPNVEIIDLRE